MSTSSQAWPPEDENRGGPLVQIDIHGGCGSGSGTPPQGGPPPDRSLRRRVILTAFALLTAFGAGALGGHFAWDQLGMVLHFIGDHLVLEFPIR
jgi:hypothetical protein